MNPEKISKIILQYIKKHKIIGCGVVIIDNDNVNKFFLGKMQENTDNTINENSLFEIGSLTKLFTDLIFEKLSEAGIFSLDDKISNFLPDIASVKDITLRQVITHTSGIPRLPKNLKPTDIRNPYKEYSEQDLIDFFKSFGFEENNKNIFEYSNLGYALLSYILMRKENDSYENIIKKNVLIPLEMKNTYTHAPKDKTRQITQGYNAKGEEAPRWDQGIFIGAGGLISSISDMEKFLKWNLIQSKPLLALMKQKENFWHNGMTGGYSSFMTFNREKIFGLVILSNTAIQVDGLAKEILESLKL